MTGPTLVTLAREEAKRLGMKVSLSSRDQMVGWLTKFKARHEIKAMYISSEGKQVDIQVVKDWKTELPNIISSFGKEDNFNCD